MDGRFKDISWSSGILELWRRFICLLCFDKVLQPSMFLSHHMLTRDLSSLHPLLYIVFSTFFWCPPNWTVATFLSYGVISIELWVMERDSVSPFDNGYIFGCVVECGEDNRVEKTWVKTLVSCGVDHGFHVPKCDPLRLELWSYWGG